LTKVHDDEHGKIREFNVESCRLARIDAMCCLLCTEWAEKLQKSNQSTKCNVKLEQFQQHLGSHMEQLALAALPPYETNEDVILEEVEDSEEQGAEELLQMLRQEQNPKVSSTLDKIQYLGNKYRKQRRFLEAESLFREALEISKKAIEGADPSGKALNIMDFLALVYLEQGKLKEAEELQQLAVEVREKTIGEGNLETLFSNRILAVIFIKQGKREQAENLLRRVIDGLEKALGVEHSYTLIALNDLAHALLVEEKLKEAEELYRRILTAREKTRGPEHPDTQSAREGLAVIFAERSKMKDSVDKRANTSAKEAEELHYGSEFEVSKRSIKDKEEAKTDIQAFGMDVNFKTPLTPPTGMIHRDSIPAYHLNKIIVDTYLQLLFGDYPFAIEVLCHSSP
jgi:tetratricopeptide (TPR) repeat protein